eukprot:7079941-Lingulodinium_polyedra.AAC.1
MPAEIDDDELPSEPDTMVHRVQQGRRDGSLEPGGVLTTAIDAGAQFLLRGVGEHATIVAARRFWLRISVPVEAATRAAQLGAARDFAAGITSVAHD